MDVERYDLMELTSVVISRLMVLDSGAVLCLSVSVDQVLRLYRILPATHGATTIILVAKWSSSRRGKVAVVWCIAISCLLNKLELYFSAFGSGQSLCALINMQHVLHVVSSL